MDRTALCTLGDIPPLSAHRGPIVKPLPADLFTTRGSSAETRWEAMAGQGYHTPNDRFFVGNHTTTPFVDAHSWRLRLHGDGLAGPRLLTYADLRRLPARTMDVAIECAHNGRSLFGPRDDGWGLGGIGVARWRGAPLRSVLALAGIRPEAVDVLATGLDDPVEGRGHVRHVVPLAKALDDVLVAYEMNGVTLPPDHGYPARLVVPGWVGIASVKWLGDVEVSTRPLDNPFGTGVTTPSVKSAFELPRPARIPFGRRHVLRGRSWSGAGAIAKIEVSTDGGRSWRKAFHRRGTRAWTPWHLEWCPREKGPGVLLARAVDHNGYRQPEFTAYDKMGYLFDAIVAHPVIVE
ncbi:molybdopterin-dependent oxidoreductase [Herbidospora sp. NBRC 101105]|uniref:molybdopterin-dependent oxidoreductase n=1 Tax=Herbidospora sp. NBRC 101105 TaxID=3032195 RepID=UPI0024A516BD|nr:molybdopterin-dependent oxidoreductase [Herbidospora sp. NBRC 101105]GLX94127.1 sulfite oxidase [Herbidospora sp. NBRC 101105]